MVAGREVLVTESIKLLGVRQFSCLKAETGEQREQFLVWLLSVERRFQQRARLGGVATRDLQAGEDVARQRLLRLQLHRGLGPVAGLGLVIAVEPDRGKLGGSIFVLWVGF